MLFTLLEVQISSAEEVYYVDIASAETEESDCADGLYSLFHLAYVQGEWFIDVLFLKNLVVKPLIKKFFS